MRKLKGTVVSNKMQHTIVVLVERLKQHRKYKKYYKVNKRFKVHVGEGEYQPGDVVMIAETKPTSKEKRWKVVELLKKSSAEKSTEDTGEASEEIDKTQ